jgi:hypothetical protein
MRSRPPNDTTTPKGNNSSVSPPRVRSQITGQAGGLAGGLARAPARRGAAVPLAITAAMVGEEKLPA